MNERIPRYERLRSIRINRDLPQTQVAKRLNIAQNTLSQYEAGLRNVPNEVLIAMALLYETSTDYLLGLTDNPAPYPRGKNMPTV